MELELFQQLRNRVRPLVPRFLEGARARSLSGLERARSLAVKCRGRAIQKLSRRELESLRRIEPVTGLVLVVGGMVAGAGYFAVNDYATVRLQRELDFAASEVSSFLNKATDRHVEVAKSTGALFGGPNAKVNRWAFFEFARSLSSRNPELGAVEWVPRVFQEQRVRFEKRANADGLFDFQFVQRASDGRRRKAATRPEYYPVYFVEPYPGNEAELGLDLAVDGDVAAVLERIRDSGNMTAAPARFSVKGEGSVPGFSIFMPVYRSSVAPFSVSERRKNLAGFVRANFRLDKLLESLRAGIGGLPALDLYIFDRTDIKKPSLIQAFSSQRAGHAGPPIDAKTAYDGPYIAVDHEVAGWRWKIVVKPVLGAFHSVLGLTAWGFVGFTLLLTALLLRHLSTMRRAREQAEAANRAKSDFLAMMSHELRTPLNAVIGFSEMMINELFGPLSNDHYKDYTSHINRSATHLLGLINSILDLSKIEAGHYTLDRSNFSLSEIWGSTYPILQASLRDSGVEVTDNISESSLTLHADPGVFRQILHNLISNAIKFTPPGGRVSVMADTAPDGRFSLCVSDSGIGIAQEDIDLVLTPFGQVDSSLSRKFDGVGLGLPLTRKLVELHGGELRIDSQPNEGTDVTIDFPADMIVDAQPPCGASESAAADAGSGCPPENRAMASGS